jgi:hypothetical protein
MSRFCVGELGLTEQVAKKLIRVGRTALRFPEIFPALADGRLNATAVIILAPWLTPENASGLLKASERRSNEEIKQLLAERFPRPDVALRLEAVPGSGACALVSAQTPGTVAGAPGSGETTTEVSAQTPGTPAARPRVAPLSPGRFEARFTMGQATHEVMACCEELLGRRLNSEDMDRALALGLKAMVAAIEKRRCAATDRPRKQRKAAKGRHIPAEVKRQVRARDGNRCTFVAGCGRRCEARGCLEFHHIEAVAHGGESTVANLRLRCRAHNQYEAEQVFGAGFMEMKRRRSGRATGEVRSTRDVPVGRLQSSCDGSPTTDAQDTRQTESQRGMRTTQPAPHAADLDVAPWLRKLGFRKEEARLGAEHCSSMMDAPLEQRVKAALSFLSPPVRVSGVRGTSAAAG